MGSPLYFIETGVVLVTMFTVLVAAHELGHYLFARLFNMGVEEFAIGFGKKPILNWMHKTYELALMPGQIPQILHSSAVGLDLESSQSRAPEDIQIVDTPKGQILRETTRFTVRPWPLGGFVRIKGMMPEEDGAETKIAGGFYNKPAWQRLVVLFAGPMFSVMAGILILVPLYLVMGAVKGDNKPIFGPVLPDGPAAKAGIKEKDVVVSIDGKPVSSFYDILATVRDSANKQLHFSLLREGHPLMLVAVPELQEASPVLGPDLEPTGEKRSQGKLMISPGLKQVSLSFMGAVKLAVEQPIKAVAGLVDMVGHPSTIKDNVGGPIAISAVTYDRVKNGFPSIVELAALLSISIGILNLLPVAPLDGGQIMLALAEIIRGGRRLSLQVQSLVTMCGFAFMCVLIICVFFIDISRYVPGNSAGKEQVPVKAAK